ncbi:DUF2975 domain-containing protein [Paenibacillus sp. Soil787]|uniref:DUF2975 domain-containing protein n=1 Tax=Paenibacillus sp. Soil787 TaxID=1736411 RepID=UPI0007024749|nr:DUF2975 domain-containing protein [Paenibacillus sp. Soil787]KRF13663.1 hypothetical protein ASG93_14225 [Paenibacillus sp. Soil787]
MNRETLFLKVVVFLIGIPILALCIFWLPWIGNEAAEHYPELAYWKYPVLIGLYVTAIAYFAALYQTLRLLSYIDKNKAFSELSVKALKTIKYCAITISVLYAAGMPLIVHMAQEDDAPGLGVLGLVLTCAPIVIAVFAAVLQKLLKNAIDIKSENDLTV